MTPENASHYFDIENSRVLNAPREQVYEAFSDPACLAGWWGPAGFTNDFLEFDLRPGGAWRFVMHGPDGAKFENEKEFVEVTPPQRIVVRHLGPMHGFLMTMDYEDLGESTRLTWRMRFESTAENLKFESFIRQANEQNFDRLAACLAAGP